MGKTLRQHVPLRQKREAPALANRFLAAGLELLPSHFLREFFAETFAVAFAETIPFPFIVSGYGAEPHVYSAPLTLAGQEQGRAFAL